MKAAEHVLSRIRHSPHEDSSAYIIGYEDRFYGIMEIDLETWDRGLDGGLGSIPMHRIRYFRKNGQIVWDRRTRLDTIWGSGEGTRPSVASSSDSEGSTSSPSTEQRRKRPAVRKGTTRQQRNARATSFSAR